MIKYLKSVVFYCSCQQSVWNGLRQSRRKKTDGVTQQNGTCTGVVKDATGRNDYRSASVVVKGSNEWNHYRD